MFETRNDEAEAKNGARRLFIQVFQASSMKLIERVVEQSLGSLTRFIELRAFWKKRLVAPQRYSLKILPTGTG